MEIQDDWDGNSRRLGWKFKKISGFCIYHFKECVPEDVIYQLDYNQKGLAHKDEYVKMFEDCGWEYLQDYMGYSYFRKVASEAAENEEIFCDSASRIQMMERVYKGRLVPLLIVFFGVIFPQLYIYYSRGNMIFVTVYGGLFALYVLIFTVFICQYWKCKKGQ